jgi:hypothetical protein
MYSRKKSNRSGTISVVVVSKSQGQTNEEADVLMEKAPVFRRIL